MAKSGSILHEKVGLKPVKVPKEQLLGAHMSIAGGAWRALERAQALGGTAVQLFVKNNNQWKGKIISPEEAEKFREWHAEMCEPPIVGHNCYLINMASPREDLWQKSIDAMVDELERCELLGITDLVAHPGSHVGEGEEAGLERIAQALKIIFDRTEKLKVGILLETTAGQGTNLGADFSHIAWLMGRLGRPARLGSCIDTCHIHAAGYDISTLTKARKVLKEYDEVVGLDTVRMIHMNDSKRECGSRVDRHENIGEGAIGFAGFEAVLKNRKLRNVPKILETPKGIEGEKDWDNLQALVDLLK